MREGVPQMVVRYTRWRDRFRALWPGRKRRQRELVQGVLNSHLSEIESEVELRMRDLFLYGTYFVDGNTGKRIPPEDVRVFPRA